MSNAVVIVSTARTPLAKSWRGGLNMTHGATLAGHAIQHAVERSGVDPAEIEDVMMGCGLPEGSCGNDVARMGAMRAGLPVSVSGGRSTRHRSKAKAQRGLNEQPVGRCSRLGGRRPGAPATRRFVEAQSRQLRSKGPA